MEGSVPHEVSQDGLRGEWFLWYPGTLWVCQYPLKPSQGEVLQGFSPNPKNPWAPLGPWWAHCGCRIDPLKELLSILLPAALSVVAAAAQLMAKWSATQLIQLVPFTWHTILPYHLLHIRAIISSTAKSSYVCAAGTESTGVPVSRMEWRLEEVLHGRRQLQG